MIRPHAFKRLTMIVIVLVAASARASAKHPGHDARDLDPDVARAMDGIRASAIKGHMSFLADDLLEGRGTGTRGYDVAAAYVAARFEAMGLEAVTPGYLQPVPLRRSQLEPGSTLTLRRGKTTVPLVEGRDFYAYGSLEETETDVTAPAVFVGFGISAPELRHDDYAGLDVRGKVVVMINEAPARFPTDERALYSSRDIKREEAGRRGAVGLIMVRSRDDEARVAFDRAAQRAAGGSLVWLDAQGRPEGAQASGIRFRATLSRTGAEALFEGAKKSFADVQAAIPKGKVPCFDLPATVSLKTRARHAAVTSPNVIGVLRGSDPERSKEYVVLTAHLDHLGVREGQPGDNIYNGAYDNAAGVATLLEVAQALTALPRRPARSLMIVALTGEESGLLGSEYFVHAPPVPRTDIVANVNIDMFLTLFPVSDIVAIGAEHTTLREVVQRATGRFGFKVTPDPFPSETLFIRSDQYSFVRKGIPAVFLITGNHSTDPKVDADARLREWLKTTYHTPKDDMSQAMDFGAAADVAKVNFLIAHEAASDPQRPAWRKGDFFGKRFAGTP